MKEDIAHLLEKTIVTGLTGAVIACGWRTGFSAQFQIGNMIVPFFPLAALISAANSGLVDALHLGFNKGIPIDKKPKDIASFVTGTAISGITFPLALALLNPDLPSQYGRVAAVITGVAAELAGAGIYYQLKQNLYL